LSNPCPTPTWRSRVTLFVWVISFNFSGMGGTHERSFQDHWTSQAPLLCRRRGTFRGALSLSGLNLTRVILCRKIIADFGDSPTKGICIRLSESDANLHTVHKTTHRLLRTTATTPGAEHHMQQHTTSTPEDGHIDARNM